MDERLSNKFLKLIVLEQLEPFLIGQRLWIGLRLRVVAILWRSWRWRPLIFLLPESVALRQSNEEQQYYQMSFHQCFPPASAEAVKGAVAGCSSAGGCSTAGGPPSAGARCASRNFLRRPILSKNVKLPGMMNTPMKVATNIPKNTLVPITFCAPAPAPLAFISGTTPRIKANAVMRIGRKRRRAEVSADSSKDIPSTFFALANSTIRMAFFAASPISMTKPTWTYTLLS